MTEPNDRETELEIQKNKAEALKLADLIFKIVQKPELQQLSGEDRHKLLVDKYPNFAKAYPIILRFMGQVSRYNRRAFQRFLDHLVKNPGKGIDGFISCQAYYAKFLYIEETKKRMGHYSVKHANEIWKIEYEHMKKAVKDIEKKEKEAKNEYKEESKKNLETLRYELLDFVKSQPDAEIPSDDDEPPALDTAYETKKVEKEDNMVDSLETPTVKEPNLMEEYNRLLDREYELIDLMHEKNRIIENIELTNLEMMKKKYVDERTEWLKGTVLDKTSKRKKINNIYN